jgi:hypothetical protein
MKLQTAISRATAHLLKSTRARTYRTQPDVWGDRKSYVIDLERDDEYPNCLNVTTWGCDYESIEIPTSRPQLISLKCRAQMGMLDQNEIALRYYLDILNRESNG